MITSNVCSSASSQWSFVAPGPPSSIPSGNYSIQWKPTQQYLTVDPSSFAVSATSTTAVPFYYEIETPGSDYQVSCVTLGPETPKQGYSTSLITNGIQGNCNSQTQLMYVTDALQTATFCIQLSTDGTIFETNGCNWYFEAAGNVVAAEPVTDPNIKNWTFAPLASPSVTALPSGLYSIYHKDIGYAYLLRNDPTYGDILKFQPTFDLSVCAFQWDASKKTLTSACSSNQVEYLYLDPSNPKWAKFTTDSSKALTTLTLYDSGLVLSSYQNLAASLVTLLGISYSSLYPSTFSVLPLTTPAPTPLPSGFYTLKFQNQCVSVSGTSVSLNADCSKATVFEYDSSKNTLQANGQCLLNPNVSCSNLSAGVTVGDCSNTAQSQRFLLGQNNSLFDPVLQFCYGPSSSQTGLHYAPLVDSTKWTSSKASPKSRWWVWCVWIGIGLLVFMGVLVLLKASHYKNHILKA